MIVTEPLFHTLANGLRVALQPQPHVHSLGIGLYVGVGSRYETAETNGISHFLEHILFRGNKDYPSSLEINQAVESWGGTFNAYTAREETQYYTKLHPDFLKEGLQFFSSFVTEPTFSGIEQEREIILEERLEDVNEDGQDIVLYELSQRAFWGRHPLGLKILGNPDNLKKLQEAQLRQHFEKYYGARNTVLCITGRFDPEVALRWVEEFFGTMRAGEKHSPEAPSANPTPAERSSFVSEDETQVELGLVFLGPGPSNPEYRAIVLGRRLLGSGMSSRLYNRIVDELGLCYDVWAELDIAHDFSFLEVGASVAPSKCLQVMEEIAKEVARLRTEEISEEELEQLKKRWLYQQEFALDNVSGINESLGVWTLYDRYRPFEERKAAMMQWTPASLRDVWSRWLTPDKMVLGAVGNISKRRKRSLKEAMQTILGENVTQ